MSRQPLLDGADQPPDDDNDLPTDAVLGGRKLASKQCHMRRWEQKLCLLSPVETDEDGSGARNDLIRRVRYEMMAVDWLRTVHFEDGLYFDMLTESPVAFLPTYRISKQTVTRYDLRKGKSGRYAGYADRILYSPTLASTAGEYRSWPVVGSDHLPVTLDLAVKGGLLRVVTYNCGGKQRALDNFWRSVVISKRDATFVICLQEIELPRSRFSLVPRIVADKFHVQEFQRCGNRVPYLQARLSNFSQAIVVLSPLSGLQVRVERVSACRSSNWLATKGWLHADVFPFGAETPVKVYCLHAPFVDAETTRRFFTALQRELLRFQNRTYNVVPFVVAGDLNSRSIPIGLPYSKNVARCPGPCTPAKVR